MLGLLAIGIVAIADWFQLRPAHPLTEKDSIVLADFINTTGDPVFDDALKQGLSVHLSQSPFFNFLSRPESARDLKADGTRSRGRAHRRSGARDLRAQQEQGPAGRLYLQPRQPIRDWIERR